MPMPLGPWSAVADLPAVWAYDAILPDLLLYELHSRSLIREQLEELEY